MLTSTTKSRITHQKIAELAGVGVATVDRVLNQRGGVAADKADAILKVAQELGYERRIPKPIYRIEVWLPRNPTPYWQVLGQSFERLKRDLPEHCQLRLGRFPENDLVTLKKLILRPARPRKALIVAADAAEQVRPWLDEVLCRGERVVTLTTEIPGLSGHVHSGIDNLKTGRTAAWLMRGRLRGQGRVLLLASQDRRAEMRQRVQGFLEGMDGRRVDIHWTESQRQRQADLVASLMAAGDVVGLYDASHDEPGMGEVIRRASQRPVWIAHECSPFHRAMASEGLMDFILDQDPELQAGYAMHAALLGDEALCETMPVRSPRSAQLRIFCPENI